MGQHQSESEPQNRVFHADCVQDSAVSHCVGLFMAHCHLLHQSLQMHSLLPLLLLSKETWKGLAEGMQAKVFWWFSSKASVLTPRKVVPQLPQLWSKPLKWKLSMNYEITHFCFCREADTIAPVCKLLHLYVCFFTDAGNVYVTSPNGRCLTCMVGLQSLEREVIPVPECQVVSVRRLCFFYNIQLT